MNHLSAADLMDVVEGTASRELLAHSVTCEWCHRSVRDARQGADLARRDDLPEPSPLFWAHLSGRVRDAVARDGWPGRAWLPVWWTIRPAGLALTAALALVIGVAVWTVHEPGAAAPAIESETLSRSVPAEEVNSLESPEGDEPWSLVSTVASGLASEAGSGEAVSVPIGSAERAIQALTDGERAELARLLRERLGES